MTVNEVLRAAKAKIENEENWCKGSLGLKDGERSCALGAVIAVAPRDDEEHYRLGAMKALREAIGGRGIIPFNDAPVTTHQEVMDMFDAAIEATNA